MTRSERRRKTRGSGAAIVEPSEIRGWGRHRALRRQSVSELARVVRTPATEPARFHQRADVSGAERERADSAEHVAARRRETIDGKLRLVADLAVAVVPPAAHAARVRERAGIEKAREN